jgi:hypothetical protein
MEFTTKKEEAAFYKDCFEIAQKERDYEHNRYLEELIKRGELQEENEELKEEIELERKRRVHWFSGSEGQMRNRVSKLSEEVAKLKEELSVYQFRHKQIKKLMIFYPKSQ